MKPELNLAFWKNVKNTYLTKSWYCYLCNATITFRVAWKNSKPELRRLAAQFLQETNSDVELGNDILFNSPSRDLRIAFLDWNIRRLSDK